MTSITACAASPLPAPRRAARTSSKEGRAETAVVLLRDPDPAAFEEPWPPRYGFHARILKAIRANQPKAPAAVPLVDRAGPRQRLPGELSVHSGHSRLDVSLPDFLLLG